MNEPHGSSRPSSHPPSDPHPGVVRGKSGVSFAPEERPTRLPLITAVTTGIVLVGVGVYLWRRPAGTGRDGSGAAASTTASAAPLVEAGAAFAPTEPAKPPVALTEMHVLGCHDRGPGRTPPEQCDHPAPVEQALTRAIENAATCVPPSGPGGSLEYVLDVSFLRHKVRLSLPRSGRLVADRKAVNACAAAVREAMATVALDGVGHQHAQYKVSVTATYPGKT